MLFQCILVLERACIIVISICVKWLLHKTEPNSVLCSRDCYTSLVSTVNGGGGGEE